VYIATNAQSKAIVKHITFRDEFKKCSPLNVVEI